MIGGQRVLAIIPARSGSKRLPRKNLLPLGGKPLVEWSIRAGKDSHYVDEVLVSTDSDDIIQIAKGLNVNVPFKRPAELSSDTASSVDVLIHAINFLKEIEKKSFDYVVLLQPTSPLRDSNDVDQALEFLVQKKADAVVSVCPMDHSPLWANILPDNLSMENFIRKEVKGLRSQDLPTYYRINGAIYICKIERLFDEATVFLSDRVFAFIMEPERSIDIDTDLDLSFAQLLVSREKNDP